MSAPREWYLLRNCVYDKDFESASGILTDNPGLKVARNGIGETVLHFLAVEDDSEGVKWLYERGFDLNTENDFGQSVLFEAAALGYTTLVDWLVSNGADLHHTDNDGDNIFEYLKGMDKIAMVDYLRERYT